MSTTTNTLSPRHPEAKFKLRANTERGGGDYGWLKTFHSFSIEPYGHPDYEAFGSLRVINEDRIEPSKGFGLHAHREMEIFTYVVSGELEHKDSMGNVEVLKRGDIQLTRAGTGIRHSEYNHSDKNQAHFMQIWALPSINKLEPKYFTRHFADEEKTDKFLTVVAPVGSAGVNEEFEGTGGPAPVHSPLSMKAAVILPGRTIEHTLSATKAYIHLIQTSGYNRGKAKGNRIRLNGGLELGEGDGSFVWAKEGETVEIENVGTGSAEVLVFDIEDSNE